MKPTALLTIALLASGALISCEKAKEAVAEKVAELTPKEKADALLASLVGNVEKTVAALEGVTDKATAEAAVAKIKEASEALAKSVPEVEVMKKVLSEADNAAMKEAAEKAMAPLMTRMMAASEKAMANEETRAILAPVMEQFQKAMMGPAPEEAPAAEPTPAPEPAPTEGQ